MRKTKSKLGAFCYFSAAGIKEKLKRAMRMKFFFLKKIAT